MNRRDFLKLSSAGGIVTLFGRDAFSAALGADRKSKTIVFGGSAFALGFALAHPEDVLVLERGMHLAPEFACTCGQTVAGVAKTPLGRELLARLAESHILVDGVLELPPLADFLSVFFADHGGKAFMNVELAAVEKAFGGWNLRTYGVGDGFLDFSAGRFLDTTDTGWRELGAVAVTGKRFGGIAKDGYFTVDLPPDADWRTARLALYDAWEKTGKTPDELLAEVNAMRCMYGGGRIVRRMKAGYAWVPSAQFPTLVEAFEEGLLWKSV